MTPQSVALFYPKHQLLFGARANRPAPKRVKAPAPTAKKALKSSLQSVWLEGQKERFQLQLHGFVKIVCEDAMDVCCDTPPALGHTKHAGDSLSELLAAVMPHQSVFRPNESGPTFMTRLRT